ncbi:MAG: hypothetical protein ACRDZQ_04325, partial [Acidimicrobiales bacterium]
MRAAVPRGTTADLISGLTVVFPFWTGGRAFVFPVRTADRRLAGSFRTDGTVEQLEGLWQMELVPGALSAGPTVDASEDHDPGGFEGSAGSGGGVLGDTDAGDDIPHANRSHPTLVGAVRAEREVFQSHPRQRPQLPSPYCTRGLGYEHKGGPQQIGGVLDILSLVHVPTPRAEPALGTAAARGSPFINNRAGHFRGEEVAGDVNIRG